VERVGESGGHVWAAKSVMCSGRLCVWQVHQMSCDSRLYLQKAAAVGGHELNRSSSLCSGQLTKFVCTSAHLAEYDFPVLW
jgi:hypothetical protein